jgi:hypothetical protein
VIDAKDAWFLEISRQLDSLQDNEHSITVRQWTKEELTRAIVVCSRDEADCETIRAGDYALVKTFLKWGRVNRK